MTPRKTPFLLTTKLALLPVLFAATSWGQPGYQFGQNKVHYKNFDWAVLRTENFDVHYYTEEAEAAKDAARMAERGYAYLREVLEHDIKDRIPLVLYSSLNDFQQTNVVQGLIGEGTRGVTESMKKRVVLPITGSYREFNHVLVHELVHAFQFDIMSRSRRAAGAGRLNAPLWFVEGMAEYLSVGMDNMTRMWVRDGLLNDNLLSVEKLGSTYDIRVYRLGEAVWNFVGETYGKKKVGQIFKTALRTGDLEKAFKAQINMDLQQLTGAWHEYARSQVLPASESLQPPDRLAERITKRESFFHRMNLVPAVSPDGKGIAYVANKNLVDEIYLLTETEDGQYEDRRLVKGGQSRDFESLRFFDTSISWSRDGSRIAFVSKTGKDDAIYILNPHSGETIRRLVFARLNGLLSPSFSPDGSKLVFVGITGGRSDLYLVNLRDETLTRLTEDLYAERHPQWSPDGKTIAFASDYGTSTDESRLLFGDYDLALYSLATGEIELITALEGNAINPQWSPDGSEIAFVSDHQGVANIYRINLASGEITPVTWLQNGVAGITETTPAMSWSADGHTMVFSTFWQGSWHLYRMKLPAIDHSVSHDARVVSAAATPGAARRLDESKSAESLAVSDSLWLPTNPEPNDFYSEYALGEDDSIEKRDYSSVPSFTAATVGASFGGFFGAVGGAQFLFSDVLNNHNLIFSANLRRNILDTDLGLIYLNQSRRLNWGLETFQLNNAFGVFFTPTATGFVQQTYRGLNAFAYFPFSRFSRFEINAGATFVEADFVVESIDFRRGRIRRDKEDLGTASFGQFGGAWVYDNTVYGLLGPFRGTRTRVEVQRATNDFKFTTLIADYRRYFNVDHRSVVAVRTLAGASYDDDAQVFRLGGPYTYRGADYGDLLGTRFLIQNIEYRYPLFPFLPASADFLSGVAFVDAAAAWGLDVPGLIKETFQPFSTDGGFHLQDLSAAFGVGARFNLGYFLLRFDVAWPTDLRSVDKPIRFFSIGTDF